MFDHLNIVGIAPKLNLKHYNIEPQNRRYPFCLVWTPIPIISWAFPFVGHLGIGQSDGIVNDFVRSYRVIRDSKRYGRRLKILPLDPNLVQQGIQGWDDGIKKATSDFCKKQQLHLICKSGLE